MLPLIFVYTEQEADQEQFYGDIMKPEVLCKPSSNKSTSETADKYCSYYEEYEMEPEDLYYIREIHGPTVQQSLSR